MRKPAGYLIAAIGAVLLIQHGPLAYPDVTPMRLFLTYWPQQTLGFVLLWGGLFFAYWPREG